MTQSLNGDRDLGPKQIEWLKTNVHHFRTAKEQADASIAHTKEVAAKIETAA